MERGGTTRDTIKKIKGDLWGGLLGKIQPALKTRWYLGAGTTKPLYVSKKRQERLYSFHNTNIFQIQFRNQENYNEPRRNLNRIMIPAP
jgi:hypothetical protein